MFTIMSNFDFRIFWRKTMWTRLEQSIVVVSIWKHTELRFVPHHAPVFFLNSKRICFVCNQVLVYKVL